VVVITLPFVHGEVADMHTSLGFQRATGIRARHGFTTDNATQ
jgi:hypothetical protein